VAPSEEFTVAAFQAAAREAAHDVWQRGASVLYVGGTGLYGRAVLDNFDIPARYPELRSQLEARAVHELADLYSQLCVLDPLAASRMEQTNTRRIVRALEVTLGSGRAFSSFGAGLRTYGPVRVVQVGLRCDLETLDERITSRFHSWLDEDCLMKWRVSRERPEASAARLDRRWAIESSCATSRRARRWKSA